MVDTARVGILLFVAGVFGFFYLADSLFAVQSGPWYFITVASIIEAIAGLVLMWRKWGKRNF